jgi:hypothetical protein
MSELVQTLTDEEAKELGILGDGDVPSADNAGVEAIIRSGGLSGSTDSRGRPIISFRQYKMLSELDVRLDDFSLRVYHQDDPRGTWVTIQAGKYLKAFGQGYRPIEEYYDPKLQTKERPPTFWWCKEHGYPECERGFDSKVAMETHWALTHKKAFKSKRNK